MISWSVTHFLDPAEQRLQPSLGSLNMAVQEQNHWTNGLFCSNNPRLDEPVSGFHTK